MDPFPHHYQVESTLAGDADKAFVNAAGAEQLTTSAPPEFGGTDEDWSPETLLTGAVATCFLLSFKAVAEANKFAWSDLSVAVNGELDRVERTTKFTRFTINATLSIADDAGREQGEKLLSRAERVCLVSNSLTAEVTLNSEVRTAETAS